MISKKSFEPLVWAYQLGALGRFIPFYWDSDQECLVPLVNNKEKWKDYMFWKFFAFINLLVRFSYMGYVGCFLVFGSNIQAYEIIMGLFFICTCLLTIPMHFVLIFEEQAAVRHMNSLLLLNKLSGECNIVFIGNTKSIKF